VRQGSFSVTIERQIWSRLRSAGYWVGATAPVIVIGLLLFGTAKATSSPATVMFIAILAALWIGGAACVREIVDERKLVQREPHLSLLAYAVAKIVHAVLIAAGQSLIMTLWVLASGIVGLPLLSLWLILCLTTVSGSMLALLLSALCDEAATALAWFPLLLVPQVIFGGFLFSYGPTRPFALAPDTGRIVLMPAELTRSPVQHWTLKIAGALCVSRWALEAYAADVFEQNLADRDHLQEAIQVSFFVPLTLVDASVGDVLITYVTAATGGHAAAPPRIGASGGRYLTVLMLFVVVQAALFVMVLPIRDPRRT
jgi:hypothetical protein